MSMEDAFNGTVPSDFFRLFAGDDPIKEGSARVVYPCTVRDDLVIKIEQRAGSFQNIQEWTFWEDNRWRGAVARWIAPCISISACGTVLLMRRTTPPGPDFKWPTRLPGFLTDHKHENFGLLDGRLVCHDYGLVIQDVSTRRYKAHWD